MRNLIQDHKIIIIITIVSLLTVSCITSAVAEDRSHLKYQPTIVKQNDKKYFNANKTVPSYLQKGDILFCDIRPIWVKLFGFHGNEGFSNDHCAM